MNRCVFDMQPLDRARVLHGLPIARLSPTEQRAWHRGLVEGKLTRRMADQLACAIGLHPADVYGPEWFEREVSA